MKFAKEFLQGLAWDDFDGEVVHLISDEIHDTSRWSEIHEMIFEVDESFYRTEYSRGLTECQDEIPYENYGEEIECVEVGPQEVMTTIYVVKEQ